MELTATLPLMAFLLTLTADVSSADGSWGYDGEKGAQHWHELFPQACSGKHQSPIDIRTERTTYNPDLKDFAFWYDPPRPGSSMIVKNNGHTVQVTTMGDFYVANAGLPNVYKTMQFHFHWGHAKHHGSEHLIDSKAYPLELHIVNYNSDLYEDIVQALKEKEGLAVLGVMFEISEEDNTVLEPIIQAMEQVRDPDERNQITIEPLSLRSLLPEDISKYFRYNGSLTTPGCFESVVWTVFAKPNHISPRQMQVFREILQSRHRHTKHHKRSVDDYSLVSPKQRRRERRALEVLDELALNSEQKARLRRDLEEEKHQAEKIAAEIDEENAGESHKTMVEIVHDENASESPNTMVEIVHEEKDKDDDDSHELSEVEIEYIQEKLVNNFRPVQPLNDRTVYRSFEVQDSPVKEEDDSSNNGKPSEIEILRERLKYYASTDSAASSMMSLTLLIFCLISFLL